MTHPYPSLASSHGLYLHGSSPTWCSSPRDAFNPIPMISYFQPTVSFQNKAKTTWSFHLDVWNYTWTASSRIDAHIIIYLCLNPSGVFRGCCNPMAVAERWLCYYTVHACKHVSSTGIKLSKVALSHRDTGSEAQAPGMRWDVLHMYWSYVPSSHQELEWQKGKQRNFNWRSHVIGAKTGGCFQT